MMIPLKLLLARLSLYGHGATRLHDEMVELAEWDPMTLIED